MRQIIKIPAKQVWSVKSTSTANFVALTGPINSTLVRAVRASWELAAATTNITIQPAYRMSDDGITWSSTWTGMIGSYSATSGWNYPTSTTTVATDIKNFVQFGVLVKNTSGTQIEMGQVQLRLQLGAVDGKTLTMGPEKVWSDGTTTQIFNPLIGPMSLQGVSWYRGSMELQGESGDCQTQMAFQLSDDGITWYSGAASAAAGSFATFGSEATADGLTYGTTLTAFSVAEPKRYIRWGIACKNGSPGVSETGASTLRIDIRGA